MKEQLENLKEILTVNTGITPMDAIAQFGEAFGLSDQQVIQLFPDLPKYQGKVEFDITENNKFIAIQSWEKKIGTNIDLYYGYDVENGRAEDLIDKMSLHPRNLEKAA